MPAVDILSTAVILCANSRQSKSFFGASSSNLQRNVGYFVGAGSPLSTSHGQKFDGFAVSLPDLMTLIFAIELS